MRWKVTNARSIYRAVHLEILRSWIRVVQKELCVTNPNQNIAEYSIFMHNKKSEMKYSCIVEAIDLTSWRADRETCDVY